MKDPGFYSTCNLQAQSISPQQFHGCCWTPVRTSLHPTVAVARVSAYVTVPCPLSLRLWSASRKPGSHLCPASSATRYVWLSQASFTSGNLWKKLNFISRPNVSNPFLHYHSKRDFLWPWESSLQPSSSFKELGQQWWETGLPHSLSSDECTCRAGDAGNTASVPGPRRFLAGMVTCSSILTWRMLWG